MQRFILTLNLLVLSCLWYLHNLFRKCEKVKPRTATLVDDFNPNNNGLPLSYTNGQYMRFSNVTYIGQQKKILCSTYIYEFIDLTKKNLTFRSVAEERPRLCSPQSLKSGLVSTEMNRRDYTRLWLESLMAIQEE